MSFAASTSPPRALILSLVFMAMAHFHFGASVRTHDEGLGEGPNHVDLALGDDDDDDGAVEGVAYETLKMLSAQAFVENTPGRLKKMLLLKNALSIHDDLVRDISNAKTGTGGVWKASEVYRTIYFLGYDEKFKTKNIDLYLIKKGRRLTDQKTKAKKALGPSTLKLYYVDRDVNPTYMPERIYSDAKRAVVTAAGQEKKMPDGVLAESYGFGGWQGGVTNYGGRINKIEADKATMPVDLMKLLKEKEAFAAYANFAIAVSRQTTGTRIFAQAAKAVQEHVDAFGEKGIGLYFCERRTGKLCSEGTNWRGAEASWDFDVKSAMEWFLGCPKWASWIEYVDLAVAPSYVPEDAYPVSKLEAWQGCMSQTSLSFTEHLRLSGESNFDNCARAVVGSTERVSNWTACKCSSGESVFCGSKLLAGRKFYKSDLLHECGDFQRRKCENSEDVRRIKWEVDVSSTYGFKVRYDVRDLATEFGVTIFERDLSVRGKSRMDPCAFYAKFPSFCGKFDKASAGFSSPSSCCACGGGDSEHEEPTHYPYCAKDACFASGDDEP